jgi:mxaK protein
MRRRHAHALFAVCATALALGALVEVTQLQRAHRVNAAISGASSASSDAPEAQLAEAQRLAAAGQYEAAVKIYKRLSQDERPDLRRVARYNAGNAYLRQALRNGPERALEALPLIELAKQSYRDLLREAPDDWDARYNLELALWLAPEVADDAMDLNRPSEFQRRVVRALPDFKLELP